MISLKEVTKKLFMHLEKNQYFQEKLKSIKKSTVNETDSSIVGQKNYELFYEENEKLLNYPGDLNLRKIKFFRN